MFYIFADSVETFLLKQEKIYSKSFTWFAQMHMYGRKCLSCDTFKVFFGFSRHRYFHFVIALAATNFRKHFWFYLHKMCLPNFRILIEKKITDKFILCEGLLSLLRKALCSKSQQQFRYHSASAAIRGRRIIGRKNWFMDFSFVSGNRCWESSGDFQKVTGIHLLDWNNRKSK